MKSNIKEQQIKDDAITKEDIMCHVIKQTKAVKRRLNDCWTRQLLPLTEPLETIHFSNSIGSSKQHKIHKINSPAMIETTPNVSQQSTGEEDIGTKTSELYRLINRLEKSGCTRTNKTTGEVKPHRHRPHEREQIRAWKEELEEQTRRQSERIR